MNKRRTVHSKLTFHKLNWLEYISIGLGVWFFLIPVPYEFLFTILLIIPILGLVLNGINGRPSIASLVEIKKDDKGDDDYDVADFIDFPAIAILIRVLKDFEFESFYSLLLPSTIAFAIMILLLLSTHSLIRQTKASKTWIYLSLTFNVFLYSFAGTYGANCVYDNSTPKVYEVEVINKRVSRGRRHTSYYIKITPWGHHYDPEEVSVTGSQYNDIQPGDRVDISLYKGLFNIPWFHVAKSHKQGW